MKIQYPRWLIERTESWVDRYFGWGVIQVMLIGLAVFFLIQFTQLIGVIVFLIQPVSERGWSVLWSDEFKVWDGFRETGFGAVMSSLSLASGAIMGLLALLALVVADILEQADDDSDEDC